jgi:hypothetical protein
VANDIDGDGVNDYFVAAPYLDVNGENVGRVYLLSGRTADVIYRISSPEPQAGAAFGFFISAYGDADGDRKTDIAIGTDAQDEGGNDGQGKAWAFSGADGTLLFEMDNPEPRQDARFGSRIGRAGNIAGNGVPEIRRGLQPRHPGRLRRGQGAERTRAERTRTERTSPRSRRAASRT